MYDETFQRSKLYFKVLQILRIFNETIEAAQEDIRTLRPRFDVAQSLLWARGVVELKYEDPKPLLRHNWALVEKRQDEAAKMLLTRIDRKVEEVA